MWEIQDVVRRKKKKIQPWKRKKRPREMCAKKEENDADEENISKKRVRKESNRKFWEFQTQEEGKKGRYKRRNESKSHGKCCDEG